MRILEVIMASFSEIPCVNVASGGKYVEDNYIPVLQGVVDQLPQGLEALLITSDLQGFDSQIKPSSERILLGHIVANEMAKMANFGLLPEPEKIGVILAGDLYAIPELNRRGGIGNVEEVWQSFAKNFRWVTGVAGNHDYFKGKDSFETVFRAWPSIYPLHGEVVMLEDIKIAGISGIMGNSNKPWRHSARDFSRMCAKVLEEKPDILVLHEGPEIGEKHFSGHQEVRKAIERYKKGELLVICGHRHWREPLLDLKENIQILNTEFRVVLLTKKDAKIMLRS